MDTSGAASRATVETTRLLSVEGGMGESSSLDWYSMARDVIFFGIAVPDEGGLQTLTL